MPSSDLGVAFARFRALSAKITGLDRALSLLQWDQRTMMPKKGATARAESIAALSGAIHALRTSSEMGEALERVQEAMAGCRLDPAHARSLWLARRTYDRACKLHADFVAEQAMLASSAQEAWAAAKGASDFSGFLPSFVSMVKMKRVEADLVGWEGSRYDPLLDVYEPGMDSARLDVMLGSLRTSLTDLVHRIGRSGVQPTPCTLPMARGAQEAFVRTIAEAVGFDFEAGRFDTSLHPFTMGMGPHDVRITAAYDDDNLLRALYSTLHEAGHGMYEQGLPSEYAGLEVCAAPSLGLHESQSRLWENMVGRSHAFSEFLRRKLLSLGYHSSLLVLSVLPQGLYGALNVVRPSLIRTRADELTYNLHICLRYEIERALIEGSLDPADARDVWNEKMREYLGIEVDTDANGILQDIHWSAGHFGYFPTYTLGNLYAAQLYAAACRGVSGLELGFADGNFRPLLDWLRVQVHGFGSLMSTSEIVRNATGAPPGAGAFLAYAERKYGALYRL